jgi:hypothetical protein
MVIVFRLKAGVFVIFEGADCADHGEYWAWVGVRLSGGWGSTMSRIVDSNIVCELHIIRILQFSRAVMASWVHIAR